MAIESTPDGAVVFTGERDTRFYQLLVWKSALKMGCRGMHRRGRSVYAIVKEQLGFKGNKHKVLAQLEAYIEAKQRERLIADAAEAVEKIDADELERHAAEMSEVHKDDEPFCDACKQHKPCSCDDIERDLAERGKRRRE